jgi:hypothetical protein
MIWASNKQTKTQGKHKKRRLEGKKTKETYRKGRQNIEKLTAEKK